MDNNILMLIFQILSALGSIGAFGAFIFLFRRDKNKQDQIDQLIKLVETLSGQNDLMKDHNNLIAQQVEILRNLNISNGSNESLIKNLKEIEEKKLKLSVKPMLWLNGAGHNGLSGELHIDLNNKGELARLKEFKLNSNDIDLHSQSLPYDLDKGQSRYIYARTKGAKQIKDCVYEIEVIYEDKLNNKFATTIKGKGATVEITGTVEIDKEK
jgi:hypothetical protein